MTDPTSDASDDASAATDDGPDDARGSGPTDARSRSRGLTVLGWSAIGVVVLGVIWVVVTGLLARSQLEDARGEITALRAAVTAGDIDRAERLVDSIRDHTDSAHSLTSGPAWWVAANTPLVGSPMRTGRTIAAQSARLGDDVLPAVVRLARTIPSSSSRSLDSLDIGTISRLAPQLSRAADTTRSATRVVAATGRSWLSPVGDGRDDVLRELRVLSAELTGAERAAKVLPPMLGAETPQRYFLGFLNEAEARGGGGIPGAFAIVTANRGKIAFERFGTDADLSNVRADVELGREYDARYGSSDPTAVLPNSNLSPDFRDAARIWAGMWRKKTGERIDGALALDPTALSYLLNVTGPARLPDGRSVTGDDVVGITQQRQYELFPGTSARENLERKAYLVSIARAVSERMISGGSPARLVRAISRAAGERRFTVWSADAGIERELRDANWAGTLGNDVPAPYTGFVVNNAAGNKLDYYLRRRMTYARTACGAGGTATATIALTNTAPRSGLPPYVTIRADDAAGRARPGDNRLLVTYYADRSAKITELTVDGKPVPLFPLPEGNTRSATTTIELPVGATVTLTATVTEPRADGPVTVLRQPGVRPLQVDLTGDKCR